MQSFPSRGGQASSVCVCRLGCIDTHPNSANMYYLHFKIFSPTFNNLGVMSLSLNTCLWVTWEFESMLVNECMRLEVRSTLSV